MAHCKTELEDVNIDQTPLIPLVKIPSSSSSGGISYKEVALGKEMCDKVREACEAHGCFFLLVQEEEDKVVPMSNGLREDMFSNLKSLFDLPEETKNKYVSPRPYCSYLGKCPEVPSYESFGIGDAPRLDVARAFANLMWPDEGNPSFCEALNSMSSNMLELNLLVLKMVLESLGVERLYDRYVEETSTVFRLMKYKVPPTSDGSAIGLLAHTDKNALTILCQNDVQGLEVQTKAGHWIQVVVPQDAYIVIVGDSLKAWSNGRLHAARHRVVISGERDRYSCGLFLVPKEEATIEVPQELVDQAHPLKYRPFNYSHFMSYFVSTTAKDGAHQWGDHDALDLYAGLL